jgi:hypothetical protein
MCGCWDCVVPVDGCVVQCQLLWGGIPKFGILENLEFLEFGIL